MDGENTIESDFSTGLGTGHVPTFIKLAGEFRMEPSYYSFLRNMEPALSGVGLEGTIGAMKGEFKNYIFAPPGPRRIKQLDTKDGREFYSDDESWLKFQAAVYHGLEPLKASKQLDLSVTDLGLTRDFSKMATHGAMVMNPSLSPQMSKIGKSPSELPGEYLIILELLSELYSEEWTPTSIRFNNKSHFGLPHPTYKKDEKLDIFRRKIIPKGEQFAERLVDMDGSWMVANHGSYPITKLTYRVQLDALGKVRSGFDFKGFEVKEADKFIPKELVWGIFDMTAARQRVAYAVSGVANAPAQCVFAGWRANALAKYNLTWHTSRDEDVIRPILKYKNYSLWDAANFDTTFDWLEISTIVNAFQGTTPLFTDYVLRVARLPLLVKSDIQGEVGAYFLNIANYEGGHQSGVAWVSDLNKIRGTGHWLYGLLRLGRFGVKDRVKAKEYIRAFLLHQDPDFALINQGDDSLPLASHPAQLRKWEDIVSNLKFAKWEVDSGKKFIGKVIYQRHPTADIQIIPDIVTTVEKMIINERGVHSKHRKMSSMGNLGRIADLSAHPAYQQVFGVLDDAAREYLGDTLEDHYRQTLFLDWVDTPEIQGVTAYNWETYQFLENEDKIHYRIDPTKVDPKILAARMSTFSPTEARNAVAAFRFLEHIK